MARHGRSEAGAAGQELGADAGHGPALHRQQVCPPMLVMAAVLVYALHRPWPHAPHEQLHRSRATHRVAPDTSFLVPAAGRAHPTQQPPSETQQHPALPLPPPCRAADIWLNKPEVRKAIHAEPVEAIGAWTLCTRQIYYTHDTGSMVPIHREMTTK